VTVGRWQSPARGVFVVHNGPLTALQRDWVALLAAAPGSVLGGLSALSHDRFSRFPPEQPVVISPMGSRRPEYEDLEQHWSVFLDVRDVHPARTPPRTRVARSTVDAASWEENERKAREIVLAVAQQRLVTPRQLREALQRRGRCRHRALIVESYLDAWGGIQSVPERDFDLARVEAGLPAPTRQRILRRRDGRYYLDAWFAGIDLSCEVHGIPHLRVENWDGDLLRGNEITISGGHGLQFSSYALRRHRPVVVDQLARAAARLAA
jgi:hypothetical protein